MISAGGRHSPERPQQLRQRLPQDLVDDSKQYRLQLTPPRGQDIVPMYAPATTQSYPEIQGEYCVPPLLPDQEFLLFEQSIPPNPYASYPVSRHPTGKCHSDVTPISTFELSYRASGHFDSSIGRSPANEFPMSCHPACKWCDR
jgi:hypothetical protein